ncbi:hypothetical protein F5051DRAFT_473304 [Lentinula edodes]|nr:hypothetical protein F5051DRAFT_473304 [Lentinula edodes]
MSENSENSVRRLTSTLAANGIGMPPSKKRKGAASAPRPTTVALGPNPSGLLTRMLKLTSPEALVKVLKRTLYPTLDMLPAKPRSDIVEVLQKALKDTEQIHELRNSIVYETRRKSLESQVKYLEKDAKRNWKHGYEEQGEMMSENGTEVFEWLPDLRRIGVEENIEIQAIQKCLTLCTTIVQRTENCGTEQEEGDEDEVKDDKYQDVHWTPAMHAAASRILDDRHAARLVEFNINLSRATYNTLFQKHPELKPMLFGTLRKHIFIFDAQTSNLSSTVYRSAAEIFAKDSPDDLPRLHDALSYREKRSSGTMQLFAKYFSTQESSTLREKGLEIIEQGICGPEAQKRDAFIDKFQKVAISNSFGDSYHEEFGAWDDRDVGVKSDDSDYEEEMNACQPDISRPFLVWATALCEWPNKQEAQKLWDRVNSSGDDANLLFSVEGLADSLAGRWDYSYYHNGAKQYVSDGNNFTRCCVVQICRPWSNIK